MLAAELMKKHKLPSFAILFRNHARYSKQKYCLHGENCYLAVLLLRQEALSNTALGIGNQSVRYGIMKNASNVEFVTSFAQRGALGRMKTATLKPICIIARDVVFAPVSAGQKL
jgi:hypothetical protein